MLRYLPILLIGVAVVIAVRLRLSRKPRTFKVPGASSVVIIVPPGRRQEVYRILDDELDIGNIRELILPFDDPPGMSPPNLGIQRIYSPQFRLRPVRQGRSRVRRKGRRRW